MSAFLPIGEVAAPGGGVIGIAPMPGRFAPVDQDAARMAGWGARLVLSMTQTDELPGGSVEALADALDFHGIDHVSLPIADWGAPPEGTAALWPEAARAAHRILDDGGRVLTHCAGGRGRSGMAALRLLIERGADPEDALIAVRRARPGAVETDAQRAWAFAGATV